MAFFIVADSMKNMIQCYQENLIGVTHIKKILNPILFKRRILSQKKLNQGLLKLASVLLVIVMTFQVMCSLGSYNIFAVEMEKKVTILFTHDRHDKFLPFNTEQEGDIVQLGGYARLQSAINQEKQKNPDLLLLDAGDYSMGTLFQTLFASDAIGLKIMGQMGYDAVTIGNHEFDFRAAGLASSLAVAKNSDDKLPQIVLSNVSFPANKDGHMVESLTNLKSAMDEYGVKDYTIIERSGIKIGIFGLLGKEAASNAPMSEVVFTDVVKKAKEIVNILKKDEKVDLVVCLSHSGTWKDKSRSEDEILAKKVPGIDVIISGHTHTKLTEPILVGNTIIGSCGENGENLGILNISKDTDNGDWKLADYKLKPIDSSLAEDHNISQVIDSFKQMVQDKYLNNLGMEFDDVLARTDFNFVPSSEIGAEHKEDALGNLISDAYIYAVKQAEGVNYEPVTAAIVPSGTIRGSFVKGDITVSDAFNASSLGIGKDKMSGYPLISVYLTGKELKTVCEVDASIAPLMKTAQLYISGINYAFNPRRLIFNKVTNTELGGSYENIEKIDDDKLYRVVAGLYSAQMLSVVGSKSFGILSIEPKTKDGSIITDFEAQIITDFTDGRNNEVKEWLAIAQYLQSFKKISGLPQVPMYYSQTQGRKIVETNGDIFSLLSNPNGIALGVYSIIIIIVAAIVFAIFMIIRRKRRRRRRTYNWKMRI